MIRRFMKGRYGSDQLNLALFLLVLALSLLNNLLYIILGSDFLYRIVSLGYVVIVIFAFFRMFSKNILLRQSENRKFMNFWNRLKDRNHRYFRCPHCKLRVRVPRHKGKINIRCPRCGGRFIRKT